MNDKPRVILAACLMAYIYFIVFLFGWSWCRSLCWLNGICWRRCWGFSRFYCCSWSGGWSISWFDCYGWCGSYGDCRSWGRSRCNVVILTPLTCIFLLKITYNLGTAIDVVVCMTVCSWYVGRIIVWSNIFPIFCVP